MKLNNETLRSFEVLSRQFNDDLDHFRQNLNGNELFSQSFWSNAIFNSDYAIIILKKQIPYFEIDGKNLFARCFDVINVLDLKNIKGMVFIDNNSIIMLWRLDMSGSEFNGHYGIDYRDTIPYSLQRDSMFSAFHIDSTANERGRC